MKIWHTIVAGSAAATLAVLGVIPAYAAPGEVNIADTNLRSCLNARLGQSPNAIITEGQAEAFTGGLECASRDVTSIAGLESFAKITSVDFSANNISDISPLSALQDLVRIDLRSNNINALGALSNLSKLTWLRLESNPVTDISALASIGTLENLNLNYAGVTDISAVASMPVLSGLELYGNKVTDIAPLSGLNNLRYLELQSNNVSDVSPLIGKSKLEYLRIGSNNVSDISAMASLTGLVTLYLSSNTITDLSALQELPKLDMLALENMALVDLAPLAGLDTLTQLYLGFNKIADATPLAGLLNLRRLFLNNNELVDIAALASLEKIDTLELTRQHMDLPAIPAGELQQSPFVTPDSSVVVPVGGVGGAVINAESGDWSYAHSGVNTLSWNVPVTVGSKSFAFDGQIRQESLGSQLTITDPQDQDVTAGDTASFVSTASSLFGTNTVVWESSTDDGDSWQLIPGATTTQLDIAATTVEMTGTRFRATHSNSADGAQATSEWAKLQVAAVVPTPSPTTTPPTTPAASVPAASVPAASPPASPSAAVTSIPASSAPALAETGAQGDIPIAGGGLLVLLGAALLAIRRRTGEGTH